MIHPFIPHISEEIWNLVGGEGLCVNAKWPKSEGVKSIIKYNLAIQINGKTRSIIQVNKNEEEKVVIDASVNNDKIAKYIKEKKVIKYIYVPNKILNMVVK